MDLDDVKRSWQREVSQAAIPEEMQRMLTTVQQHCDRLESSVHRRDVREIFAVILVVAAFAAAWPLYRASYAAMLGVAIIAIGGCVVVFVLTAVRRPTPQALNATVLEFSRQRLAWVDDQIRLLRTAAWWYAAPAFVGALLVAWGVTDGRRGTFAWIFALDVMVAALVTHTNRRATRDQWMPIRAELRQLIKGLESGDSQPSEPSPKGPNRTGEGS